MNARSEFPNVVKYTDVVDDEYSEYLTYLLKLYYDYGDYLLPKTLLNLAKDLADAEANIKYNCEFTVESYTKTYEQIVATWA